jgi:hypothetical protein
MINVIKKICIIDDCNKSPSFNYECEKTPLYCKLHKLENMVDIIHKKCEYDGCDIIATYNIDGFKYGRFCNIHKESEMIDIKNNKCIFNDCNKIASYNYENKKTGLYCTLHKLENMIDIKSKKCEYKDCNIVANYNYENTNIGRFCNNHKLIDMININSIRCKTPLCDTVITKKYDGYCLYCYINLFPESILTKNYRTKENTTVEFIKKEINNVDWICNKRIIEGCSKKRPDLFLDLGYQIIIVEIDENQHNYYNTLCENRRIMELSQDIGHRNMILIRFNPDDYIDINNINISSCWENNKKGICIIKKEKQNEWNDRLNLLKNTINYWINNKTDKIVEQVYLYYNYNK